METKQRIVLLSKSQGERGQWGYKKKYIIEVEGSVVVVKWGRAEVAPVFYQTKRRFFANDFEASRFATDTMYQKLDKGYELESTRP
jgi:predicted DNA-binding WGR domain protein